MTTATERTAGVAVIGATTRRRVMEADGHGVARLYGRRPEGVKHPAPVSSRIGRAAIASISTRAAFGSAATANVERAGGGSGKKRA